MLVHEYNCFSFALLNIPKRLLQKSKRKTCPRYVSGYRIPFWFIPVGFIFMLKIPGMKYSTMKSTRLFSWPNRKDCLYRLPCCIPVTGKWIPFLDFRNCLGVPSTSFCPNLSYRFWPVGGSSEFASQMKELLPPALVHDKKSFKWETVPAQHYLKSGKLSEFTSSFPHSYLQLGPRKTHLFNPPWGQVSCRAWNKEEGPEY